MRNILKAKIESKHQILFLVNCLEKLNIWEKCYETNQRKENDIRQDKKK